MTNQELLDKALRDAQDVKRAMHELELVQRRVRKYELAVKHGG